MKTSDKIQKKEYASTAQILEVQHEIGRALERLPKDRANRVLGNKVSFRKFVQTILMNLEITTQTEAVMLQLRGIVDFYKRVCDTDVSAILEHEEVFLQESFPVLGLTVKSLSISDKLEAYQKEWGINFTLWSDILKIEDIQSRPDKELQLFAHKGRKNPDKGFLRSIFNEFVNIDGKLFASADEYIAMQGIARYTTGKWLDQKVWTLTTSRWSDGNVVRTKFRPESFILHVNAGSVGARNPECGPRQIILL